MRTTSQKGIRPTRQEPMQTNTFKSTVGSRNKVGSITNDNLDEIEVTEKIITKNEYASKTSNNDSDLDELDGQVRESEIEMLDEWLCEYEASGLLIISDLIFVRGGTDCGER